MKLIIKQLEFVVYVELKIDIVFIKRVVYLKIVVLKKFHVQHLILLYIDLLLINIIKGHIINQFQIYNNFFKKITNYKDYFRLYRLNILNNLK